MWTVGLTVEINIGQNGYCSRDIYTCSSRDSISVIFRIIIHERSSRSEAAFSNSSCLKSVFEKLRFHDGLVWTVGLIVEIKLRFQILPA